MSEITQQVVLRCYIENTAPCFLKDVLTTFCCFLLWTGPRAHKCTLVQANLDPLRHMGDLVANAGRSTRDLNLSHPASYTALTRTTLVPAKEGEGTISLSLSPGTVVNKRCVMLCSFSTWGRFPSNWKPAANTGVLFRLELVIPLRQG